MSAFDLINQLSDHRLDCQIKSIRTRIGLEVQIIPASLFLLLASRQIKREIMAIFIISENHIQTVQISSFKYLMNWLTCRAIWKPNIEKHGKRRSDIRDSCIACT